jgi:formylglycine-generating enzyme required for sulfatase activity
MALLAADSAQQLAAQARHKEYLRLYQQAALLALDPLTHDAARSQWEALQAGYPDIDHDPDNLAVRLLPVDEVLALLRSIILNVLPPPFEWCAIPGVRQFRLETDAGHIGTYDISTFLMAKYQTTYEQFQVFVDDPGGFTNPQWWQGLAADANHRKVPGTQHFVHAQSLPRDNVSWYDAVAFCRWLSWRVGYEVRLPTEWEWQWAAQGPDGRAYPWGPQYIRGYANINEKASRISSGVYLEKTTLVGSYPQGASPYGVLDMSGNVWEWCLNTHNPPDGTDPGGDAQRVIRGGPWPLSRDFARASCRGNWTPYYRASSGGFRVVVLLPS